MLREVLKEAGVEVKNLMPMKEPTGQAIIQVDKSGENAITIYRGANGAVTEEHIDQVLSEFECGDIVLLQNEISNLLYLIQRAAEKGMKIILNPSPFEEKLKEIDLHDLYCIILNETEAMQWIGTKEPSDFLHWIQKEYPELCVALTLGKEGSIFLQNGNFYRQQAYCVTAVDTTAAGDTFTGYLVSGLYNGMEISDILRRASMASAIAVSRKGAASSIPTCSEVDAMSKAMDFNTTDCQGK